MKTIVVRRNKQFIIDSSKLSEEAKRTNVINGLYAAIYEEFLGAQENPKYEKLLLTERLKKVNEFAINWLKKQGLE